MELNNFHKIIKNTPLSITKWVRRWMSELDKNHNLIKKLKK